MDKFCGTPVRMNIFWIHQCTMKVLMRRPEYLCTQFIVENLHVQLGTFAVAMNSHAIFFH